MSVPVQTALCSWRPLMVASAMSSQPLIAAHPVSAPHVQVVPHVRVFVCLGDVHEYSVSTSPGLHRPSLPHVPLSHAHLGEQVSVRLPHFPHAVSRVSLGVQSPTSPVHAPHGSHVPPSPPQSRLCVPHLPHGSDSIAPGVEQKGEPLSTTTS